MDKRDKEILCVNCGTFDPKVVKAEPEIPIETPKPEITLPSPRVASPKMACKSPRGDGRAGREFKKGSSKEQCVSSDSGLGAFKEWGEKLGKQFLWLKH
jgi:hypothetical protein